MESAARVRSNPADLINAAIEVLVQELYELPTLGLLWRLAGSVSAQLSVTVWPLCARNYHPSGVYCRRALECAVLFEPVARLRVGELYLDGAAHFGNYRNELSAGDVDEQAVTVAFHECGLPETASAIVEELQSSLRNASLGLDLAISQYECILDPTCRSKQGGRYATSLKSVLRATAVCQTVDPQCA